GLPHLIDAKTLASLQMERVYELGMNVQPDRLS
ncbi:MAG: hypothetical protein ACJARM_002285, partial [Glaciecola sp.]